MWTTLLSPTVQTAFRGAKSLLISHVKLLMVKQFGGKNYTSVRFGLFGAQAFTWNQKHNMLHFLS